MRIMHMGWALTLATLFALTAITGCEGDAGADGAPGADGMDGMNGQMGAPGADGEDGMRGAMGAMGAMGEMGEMGLAGLDGDAGVDGEDGEDGEMGAMGAMGLPGASGIIDRTKLTGAFVVYPLDEQEMSGASGEVRFAEYVDGDTHATLITIRISGFNVADTLRVAHVHYNDVAAGGPPVITLNKVDGFTPDGTAMSETFVTHVDPAAMNPADATETFVTGAAITYQDIVGNGTPGTGLNGYVNVHKVAGDAASVTGVQIAAGDIGANF